jgi:hypothetical protein
MSPVGGASSSTNEKRIWALMNNSENYFNPAEVEEYKKRDKISAPKLQKFLAGKLKREIPQKIDSRDKNRD